MTCKALCKALWAVLRTGDRGTKNKQKKFFNCTDPSRQISTRPNFVLPVHKTGGRVSAYNTACKQNTIVDAQSIIFSPKITGRCVYVGITMAGIKTRNFVQCYFLLNFSFSKTINVPCFFVCCCLPWGFTTFLRTTAAVLSSCDIK